jgi:OOP family OmpA-OmpF porin
MKKIMMFVTMLLVTAAAAAAQAEVKAGAFSVTPFAGGYLFEGNQDLKHAPVFGLRGGYHFTKNWAVEGVFHYLRTEHEAMAGNPDVDVYGGAIEGLYHFMPDSRLVPFVALGAGGQLYRPTGNIKDRDRFTVDYGAGLKYFLTENLALRADVRHVLLPLHDEYNNLLYTVGLTFAFGGGKKAPAVVAARAAEPAAAPAVPVVLDSDRDGVPDNRDSCPGTPAGVQVDASGCPTDLDRDGVPDYLDDCPSTPPGVKVDAKGCPFDTDGDGVYDYFDKCPGTPKGVKVDEYGCPLPEKKAAPAPAPAKAAPAPATKVEKAMVEKGRATLNVEFDFNKATLRKSEEKDIADLADVLKRYPDIKEIVIEGHTDNVGNAKYNEKLSQQRADAVKNELVKKYGVDASRLKTKGYGMTKPIATNATKEGRQKNRRVEAAADFTIKR